MISSFKLFDSNGNDVTDLYEISYELGTLETVSKAYYGEPLTSPVLTITDGQGLREGHYFIGKVTGTATEPNKKIKNTIEVIKIYDKDGNDVTDFYDIEKNEGKLRITL